MCSKPPIHEAKYLQHETDKLREIKRFNERHQDPLTLLELRLEYHTQAAKDKIEAAQKQRMPEGSLEIYLLHKKYAENYEKAIELLKNGGFECMEHASSVHISSQKKA